MITTFIFDESKSVWVEEQDSLLRYDICAILDEDREVIYLWSGPKTSKQKFRKAFGQVKELLSKFSELKIQFFMASDNFPHEIQKKVNSMIESQEWENKKALKLSRISSIRLYSISIIITVILPFILFLNLSSCLFWAIFDGNYFVSSILYENWIGNSKIFIIITLIFLFINGAIGIIERENQIIVFSINGIIISAGLFLFLNQGIFLFLFQEGSTFSYYLIMPKDILVFLLLTLTAILIFEIPNIYKLISFVTIYKKFIF